MSGAISDVAFSASVKAAQVAHGSRQAYARRDFRRGVTAELAAFLAEVDTAYLVTASAAGQPYAQHRGGPPGFIRPLGPDLLGFADYAGNRQYINTGNLAENDWAFLFLMDYAHARRIKLWGRARMISDQLTIGQLVPNDYAARPEQALLFTVTAWDGNCSQHIPRKVNVSDVMAVLGQRDDRIRALEAEIAELRRSVTEPADQRPATLGPGQLKQEDTA